MIAALCLFLSAFGSFGEEWELSIADAALGRETATRTEKGLIAEGSFTHMGVSVSTKYEIVLDASGMVAGYTGNVAAGGRNVTAALSVAGNTARMKVEVGGNPAGEKDVPLTAAAVLMDNNIMAQFATYSAVLDPKSGAKKPLVLLVPQVLSAYNVEAELKKGTYAWKTDAASGTAVQWELASPVPLLIKIYQDVLTGAILQAEIPAGQITYRLVGLKLETQTAAAPKPAYLDSSRVEEKPLTIKNGQFSMGATLSYPKGAKGPFPGVLLVSGSGPNDRDETVGMIKPFRDIAHGLALNGFAVLRFDKRTYAYRADVQNLSLETMTVEEEFIQDSIQAFRMLAAEPMVDPARLAIVGHSLGAWGLPYIVKGLGADVAKVKRLAFLAPAGADFGGLLLRQLRERLAAAPDSAELKSMIADFEKKIADYKKTGTVSGPILGSPAAYWKDIFDRNPIALAGSLSIPMFIARGAKDIQVADADIREWKQALGGRSGVTFLTLPNLNHIFVEVEGPSTGVEYFKEGYVSVAFIQALSAELRGGE
jgi:hypothetical protein